MDAHFKALEKYNHLKPNDIPGVPDDTLIDAVLTWMRNKFDEDWSDQYQIICSLPKPCQNVFSCSIVIDEVYNGGLSQLFLNSSAMFAVMSIDGFLALGSPQLSNIMEKATELYLQNKKLFNSHNNRPEDISAIYEAQIFDALDDAFCAESESVDFVKYIRLNAAYFGD